jgi:phosphoglycerate dehydrogenase-like enzyme
MNKVLISAMTLANNEGPYFQAFRQAAFELVYPSQAVQLDEEELLKQLKGVSATLAGSEPYTRKVFEASPGLRVVARCGVGFDAVDLAAATEHGVAVCTTPGTNHDAVAEHTFALILALAKEVIPQHLATKAHQWPRRTNLPLRGQTLGIAGLGRIGKAVALRGECFGMRLLAFEPVPDLPFARQHGVELVSFDQLLADSDFLSLHLPLTADSKHLIDSKTLSRMKPTAFLINTARGGLVRETDLLHALESKKIAGAGLDVFEQEPARHNPLFELNNVVLTPHSAGGDLRSRDDMALSAAQAIIDLSRGQWPAEKVVNPHVRPRFSWK